MEHVKKRSVTYKKLEVTHSVKLNKYPKHDSTLLNRARSIRPNQWIMKYTVELQWLEHLWDHEN